MANSILRGLGAALLINCLLACSGGGGSDASPTPVPVPAPSPPSAEALQEAARLGARASFGLSHAEVQALASQGNDSWLQTQFNTPANFHEPIVEDLVRRREAGEFAEFEEDIEYLILARRLAWWHCAVTCDDQLRQRVAFALSQILVVSDNVDELMINPFALSTYFDTLLEHAFGNFRELLLDVTLHPAMGVFLSHVNNNRSDPIANTFPDENYAREVMQLFSIGLHELNPDGTLQLDSEGRPIPSYDNDDIREFAKIFTGLSFGGPDAYFGKEFGYFRAPMQMFAANHEPGEKRLLRGTVVPAGQTGMQDIEAAIDNLFNHPNTGPFISRQLIQRLVTSNPSPAYVERVANVFATDSNGVRGNLQAVVSAVLLDPEASADNSQDAHFGKLREPVLRYLNMLRVFEAQSDDGFIANAGYALQTFSRQHPLSAPSVFNFYLPSHSPSGDIADAGLVAPEFEIVNTTTVVDMVNLLDVVLFGDLVTEVPPPFANVTLSLDEWDELAANVDALLDRLDLVLTYGTLSEDSRAAIRSVLADIPASETGFRSRIAIYLVMMSPDYVVES